MAMARRAMGALMALALAGAAPAFLPGQGAAQAPVVVPALMPDGLFPATAIAVRYAGNMINWHLASRPDVLKGRPALAAKNLALFEWFAAEIERSHYAGITANELNGMRLARAELRERVGASPAAAAEQAVAGYWALSRAIDAGDEARIGAILGERGLFIADPGRVRAGLADLAVSRAAELGIWRAVRGAMNENNENCSDDNGPSATC